MRKNKAIFGSIALLLILLVGAVFAQETQNNETTEKCNFFEEEGKMFKGRFGPPMGHPMNINKEEMHEKMIEDLGLSETATEEEIREAMEQKHEEMRAEQLAKVKEKLGLPSDTTEENTMEKLGVWREENKDLIGFGMHRMHKRFGKCPNTLQEE